MSSSAPGAVCELPARAAAGKTSERPPPFLEAASHTPVAFPASEHTDLVRKCQHSTAVSDLASMTVAGTFLHPTPALFSSRKCELEFSMWHILVLNA